MSSRRRPSSILPPIIVATVIICIVVALDQLTKWAVVQALIAADPPRRIDLIPPWLAFVYVENRGAAFGLFQGASNILLVVGMIVVVGIAIYAYRTMASSSLMPVATGLILGGALGNMVDRVRLGYVVDFVAVGPWPRFNLADAAVTTGVALMFIAMVFTKEQPPAEAGDSPRMLRQLRD